MNATNPGVPQPSAFGPACLLSLPGQENAWLKDNMPSSLAKKAIETWIKGLGLLGPQRSTLNTNTEKVNTWRGQQNEHAVDKIEKDTLKLFYHFRIVQSRLMLPAAIHGLKPNSKRKSILEGCTNLCAVWGSDFDSHFRFSGIFSNQNASTFGLLTFRICSRSFTLAQHLTMFYIENTAESGNTCSCHTTGQYKLNYHFGFGMSMAISMHGHPCHCSLNEMTSEHWNLLSFKNGNPS